MLVWGGVLCVKDGQEQLMKDEPRNQMSWMIRTIAPSCWNLKITSGDAEKTVQTDNKTPLLQISSIQSNRVLGRDQVLTAFI